MLNFFYYYHYIFTLVGLESSKLFWVNTRSFLIRYILLLLLVISVIRVIVYV